MTNLLKVFNNHLVEFLDDVITIFPENTDIQTGRTFLVGIKKINPKKIIETWKDYINDKYIEEINKGDWNFFINKDYTKDLQYTSGNVVNIINDVKIQLSETTNENKQKALKYVQNLCKICKLYYK